MKKKAIIAIPYLSGNGGTETVIKNFHQAVVACGSNEYIWKLISYGGTRYPNWMKEWNKKVYNFSNLRCIQRLLYIFLLPFLIVKDLRREKPDFFIATNPVIWTLAFYYKKFFLPKTKIISWYHFSFKRKKVNERYLKTADYFWAISNGIKKELISLGVDSKKIDVIYNPINTKNIPLVKRSGDQNRFIYIGRIDYDSQKNVSELMRALNNLSGDWKCDLYGFVDKKIKLSLLNLITSAQKRKNIVFHGFSNNIWSKIKVADCLLLTSKYEGLPMVLIEAATRGIALVSSNCPTGTEDIVNRNNGYLYHLGKYDRLSQILTMIKDQKSILPSYQNVKRSVEKFDYYNYRMRITTSLLKLGGNIDV